MIGGTPTFCGVHNYGRVHCGCPWLPPIQAIARATFRVCLYLENGDLREQLREAEDTPPELPVEVYAGDVRPRESVAVDRDAWVRLVATRHLDVRSTPGRVREWRSILVELGGAH